MLYKILANKDTQTADTSLAARQTLDQKPVHCIQTGTWESGTMSEKHGRIRGTETETTQGTEELLVFAAKKAH